MAQYVPMILKYAAAGVLIGLLFLMAYLNMNTPSAQALAAVIYGALGALGLHAGQSTLSGPKP